MKLKEAIPNIHIATAWILLLTVYHTGLFTPLSTSPSLPPEAMAISMYVLTFNKRMKLSVTKPSSRYRAFLSPQSVPSCPFPDNPCPELYSLVVKLIYPASRNDEEDPTPSPTQCGQSFWCEKWYLPVLSCISLIVSSAYVHKPLVFPFCEFFLHIIGPFLLGCSF